jgi:hypothetical protein
MEDAQKQLKLIRTMEKTHRKEEAASKSWLKYKTKPCPCCKRLIEKRGGCDHMKCRLYLIAKGF